MNILQEERLNETDTFDSIIQIYPGVTERKWQPLVQRVAIYAKILFNDAYKNQSNRGFLNVIDDFFKKGKFESGEVVTIFELYDLMGKHYPVNHVTLKLIDCLKPEKFDNINEDTVLEFEYFKLA